LNIAKLAVAAAAVLSLSAHASSVNLDFSTYAAGSTLASADGVSFSLVGNPDPLGTPTIDSYGEGLLTNTWHGGTYPTANVLKFTFDQTVTDVDFDFNNEGLESSGRGASYFQAFDASGALLSTVYATGESYTDYSFGSTTGIKTIEFNNGSGGTDSWWFGVHSLTAVSAVPEPTETALFLAGLGLLGAAARRKSNAAKA
jgi:hypothetical protein